MADSQPQIDSGSRAKAPASSKDSPNLGIEHAMTNFLLDELNPYFLTKKKDALSTFENFFFRAKPKYTEKDIHYLFVGEGERKGLVQACGQLSWKTFSLKQSSIQAVSLMVRLLDPQENAEAEMYRRVFLSLPLEDLKAMRLGKHLKRKTGSEPAQKLASLVAEVQPEAVYDKDVKSGPNSPTGTLKPPGGKASKHTSPASSPQLLRLPSHVMGVSLPELVSRHGQELRDGVPLFLCRMADHLLRPECVSLVGLFRVSGEQNECQALQHALNKGANVDLSTFQPQAITSVFKAWLRELPEPLMTTENYEKIVQAQKKNDKQLVISTCYSIPDPHVSVLRFLINFLARVCLHADQNKMSPQNMAIVFAPNLLKPKVESYETVARDTPLTIAAVTTLIEDAMTRVSKEGGVPPHPDGAPPASAQHSDEPLPAPWIQYDDPASGVPFFYNPETGTSRWARPSIPKTAPLPTSKAARSKSAPAMDGQSAPDEEETAVGQPQQPKQAIPALPPPVIMSAGAFPPLSSPQTQAQTQIHRVPPPPPPREKKSLDKVQLPDGSQVPKDKPSVTFRDDVVSEGPHAQPQAPPQTQPQKISTSEQPSSIPSSPVSPSPTSSPSTSPSRRQPPPPPTYCRKHGVAVAFHTLPASLAPLGPAPTQPAIPAPIIQQSPPQPTSPTAFTPSPVSSSPVASSPISASPAPSPPVSSSPSPPPALSVPPAPPRRLPVPPNTISSRIPLGPAPGKSEASAPKEQAQAQPQAQQPAPPQPPPARAARAAPPPVLLSCASSSAPPSPCMPPPPQLQSITQTQPTPSSQPPTPSSTTSPTVPAQPALPPPSHHPRARASKEPTQATQQQASPAPAQSTTPSPTPAPAPSQVKAQGQTQAPAPAAVKAQPAHSPTTASPAPARSPTSPAAASPSPSPSSPSPSPSPTVTSGPAARRPSPVSPTAAASPAAQLSPSATPAISPGQVTSAHALKPPGRGRVKGPPARPGAKATPPTTPTQANNVSAAVPVPGATAPTSPSRIAAMEREQREKEKKDKEEAERKQKEKEKLAELERKQREKDEETERKKRQEAEAMERVRRESEEAARLQKEKEEAERKQREEEERKAQEEREREEADRKKKQKEAEDRVRLEKEMQELEAQLRREKEENERRAREERERKEKEERDRREKEERERKEREALEEKERKEREERARLERELKELKEKEERERMEREKLERELREREKEQKEKEQKEKEGKDQQQQAPQPSAQPVSPPTKRSHPPPPPRPPKTLTPSRGPASTQPGVIATEAGAAAAPAPEVKAQAGKGALKPHDEDSRTVRSPVSCWPEQQLPDRWPAKPEEAKEQKLKVIAGATDDTPERDPFQTPVIFKPGAPFKLEPLGGRNRAFTHENCEKPAVNKVVSIAAAMACAKRITQSRTFAHSPPSLAAHKSRQILSRGAAAQNMLASQRRSEGKVARGKRASGVNGQQDDSDSDIDDKPFKLEPSSPDQPSMASMAGLSANWRACIDPTTGKPYYFNTATQETVWDKPADSAGQEMLAQKQVFEGQWEGKTSGGAYPSSNWWQNPQYRVQVKQAPARLRLSLTEYSLEEACAIGLMVVKLGKDSKCQTERMLTVGDSESVLLHGPFQEVVCVESELELANEGSDEPIHLIIIPSTERANVDGSFRLEVSCDVDTVFSEIIDGPPSDPRSGWLASKIDGDWDEFSMGGCYPNFSSWRANPQFKLEFAGQPESPGSPPMETRVLIRLDCRFEQKKETPAGFYLVRNSGPSFQKIAVADSDIIARSEFAQQRHIFCEARLADLRSSADPTKFQPFYAVLPSTFQPGFKGSFTITVFSKVPFKLRALLDHERWSQSSVVGRWTKGCAGGCRNYETWCENPQLALSAPEKPPTARKAVIVLAQSAKHDVILPIGFYVMTKDGETKTKCAFKHAPEVYVEYDFDPSEAPYIVIPCTFEPGCKGEFEVFVLSEKRLDLTKVT